MSSSTQVYIRDKLHGWLPADVVSSDGKKANCKVYRPVGDNEEFSDVSEAAIALKDYPDGNLPLQNVNENGNLIEMADMCDLPYLHEAAILYNLRARHRDRMPYTRVGDIVIAVNPFQWIGHLYSDETRESYADKLVWNPPTDGDARAHIAPHVYEASSLAFRGLACDGLDQSILVSGESGAGKTETVKIVMSHLASVQAADTLTAGTADDSSNFQSKVVKRVLDSNPLLEAFGNAKTVRNDNSSRFGKYIQLQFDVEDATTAQFAGRSVPSCILAGSICETYLLEKSRVVGHESLERTYHIFYQIVAAPEEEKTGIWSGLAGTTNSSFSYVGDTDTLLIEGKTDAQKWAGTVNALAQVGVKDEKLHTLMRAVCTVLQLGNLTFAVDPSNDDGSVIDSTEELTKLADCMGVATDDVKLALTYRTVTAGKEVYSVPLKVDDSRDSRDAFSKEIYQQLFDWLVTTLNNATSAETNYPDAKEVEEFGLIGLLDIFGFESFKVNRFEQLCINYANEKLQQKYTLDIFRSVQDEYEFEGIELGSVDFSDNAEVLNLIEGRMGLVAVLNEECVRPKGNDTSFVSKLKTMNKDIPCLIQDRLHRPTQFAIEHYAGPVKYDADFFVQKNQDTIPNDLLQCAEKSSNRIISHELKAAAMAKAAAQPSKPGRGRSAASLTVATKFRHQLGSLMSHIAKTKTRYIRCIKPNPEKKPLKMNLLSSAQQLRCAGVVSAVTVSRVAFPNRLMHETAVERFRCLSPVVHNDEEKKQEGDGVDESGYRFECEALLGELLKSMEKTDEDGNVVSGFVCGKTRVYFRTGALEHLEAERLVALGILATEIQRIVRCFVARSQFLNLKDASIAAQAMARRTIKRKTFNRLKAAAVALECWARCNFARAELLRLQREKASTLIQSRWRMAQAIAYFKKCRAASVMIQKILRGAMQRPIYKQMLKEAAEEARVNSKLAALQKRLADAEMKWIQADKARMEAEKKAAGMVPAAAAAAVPQAPQAGEEIVLQGMGAQQQAIIEESAKMLEYLRGEVVKLRSKNYLLRQNVTELKQSNQSLSVQNSSISNSFEALKQHAAILSKTNKTLLVNANEQKDALMSIRKESNESTSSQRIELSKLKEELKKKDVEHAAEIALLKKELAKAQSKSSRKGKKGQQQQPTKPKTETTSLQKYTAFGQMDDPDDDYWNSDGYSSFYGRGGRDKRKGRFMSNKYKGRNQRGDRGGGGGGRPQQSQNKNTSFRKTTSTRNNYPKASKTTNDKKEPRSSLAAAKSSYMPDTDSTASTSTTTTTKSSSQSKSSPSSSRSTGNKKTSTSTSSLAKAKAAQTDDGKTSLSKNKGSSLAKARSYRQKR